MYFFVIFLFFIVFNLIIFSHEFVKYITSIKFGVKIDEFSFGIGPRIFHFEKNESTYSIRLIPIGFICSTKKGELNKQNDLKKIIILSSSMLIDIILSFILSICSSSFQNNICNTTIDGFFQNSSSDERGKLKVGDEIISINGYKTHIDTDVFYAIKNSNENNFTFDIVRNGEFIRIENVSFPSYELKGKRIEKLDFILCKKEKNFINIMIYSSTKVGSFIRMIFKGLTGLISRKLSIQNLQDPICILLRGDYDDEINKFSSLIVNLINLSVIISISLFLFNLIPIPSLKGGDILFTLIERISKGKINDRTKELVNTIGLIFIIFVSLIIIINDILNMIKGFQ